MGTIKLTSLSQYSRKGYSLRIECRCNRVALVDPRAIIARAAQAGQKVPRLDELTSRLRCAQCGKRPLSVGPGWG